MGCILEAKFKTQYFTNVREMKCISLRIKSIIFDVCTIVICIMLLAILTEIRKPKEDRSQYLLLT